MSIVPLSPEQLRAALDEDAPGTAAEGWRLLRDDVRALAPPLDPGFEQRLYESLTAGGQRDRRGDASGRPVSRPGSWLERRLRAGLGQRLLALGVAGAVCAVAIALVAAGTFDSGQRSARIAASSGGEPADRNSQSRAVESRTAEFGTAVPQPATSGAVVGSPEAVERKAAPPQASAEGGAPRRVQEQAASITLAAKPAEVQSVADSVSRLASSEGGYVVTSQVNVQSQRKGEATITLSLPSTRLTQALAALGRLAPVRSQSNSLQDITSSYESAKRALSDAVAERSGLLRALARASSQGEIESLRSRLSLAGGRISRETAALASVTRRAANSRVEVSVLSAAASSEGRSTLSRGLDEAGHVLAVVLVGLLIALAVLVPLGLLAALLTVAARHARRWQRERALGGS